MQIKSLTIKNFRCITDLHLADLPNAVAIFGQNAQGKTSVIAAIRMLLTGTCQWTDKRGVGYATLIQDGAPAATIEAALDVNGQALTVSLTLHRSAKTPNEWTCIDVETGEVYEDAAALCALAGINPRKLAVALSPERFILSQDLGDILCEQFAASVDPDALTAMAGEHADWLTAFARGQQQKLESAEDFQRIGQAAFTLRTAAKKQRDQAVANIEQFGFIVAPRNAHGAVLTVADLSRIEASVARLREKRDALLVEQGATRDVQPLPGPLEECEAELAMWADKIDSGRVAVTEAEQAVAEAEAVFTALRPETLQVMTRIDTLNAQIQAVLSGSCAACGQKLPKGLQAKTLEPIEAERDRLAARRTEIDAQASATQNALPGLREALATARADLAEAEAMHAVLLETVEPHRNPQRTSAEIAADIAATDASIAKAEQAVSDLKAMAERDREQAEHDRLCAEIAHYDWAVKAFKDGEEIKALIGDAMGEFVAACNMELSAYDHELDVLFDGKKVSVVMRRAGGAWRPVTQASNGQICLAASAVAMAMAGDACPVLVDNLNELDGAYRKQVLRRLQSRSGGSVIVAAAWQQSKVDAEAVAAALAPVRVVWMRDGALTVNQAVV